MKAQFWHERWETGQLAFHQEAANPLLEAFWPRDSLSADDTVFVPLCGKSLDMTWIRGQGPSVLGVELSPIAIRDFFDEAKLAYTETTHGPLRCYSSPGYSLYCGDYFALTAEDLAEVRAVYDRASLIALPPEMRERYAAHMIETLPADALILLLTIEYDQSKMEGPPHSVSPEEVEALYGDHFQIEILKSSRFGEPPPPMKTRGLDLWREHAFRLSPRESVR